MRTKSLGFALLFATIALFSAASHAETLVSGDVTTTAWTVSGSPYRVTGAVNVPANNTLTIEPGVDVLFDADVPFIVNGNLQALGTEAQNVRFMPGTSAEWGGIRLSGGQASTFQYVQFSGGKAEGTSPSNLGGALMVTGAGTSVNVSNCLFSGNGAASGGAVAFYTGGTGQFTATTFTGNTSTSWGGAAYIEGAGAVTFSSCTFESNTSGTKGGAVAVYRSTGLISFQATEFRGNHSGSESGIVELYGAAGVVVTASFTDCLVENNTAASDAMIYGENYSNTTITNCVFRNNTGSSHGAGLELYGGNAFATVTGSVFANNTASRGAALSIKWYATLNATNCTFVGNNITETGLGGAVYTYYNTTVNLKNCVVWGNTPNQMYAQSTTINATYSAVQGGWGGTGNINADPLFVNVAAGDYRLQPASPCIDTGDPSTTDLDGTRADMGALALNPADYPDIIFARGTLYTQTWQTGKTVRVKDAVTVDPWDVLTIEPGVDVLFDADVQFIVAGQLIANGTAQDSIRFLKGTASEWGGLRFVPGDTLSSWISYARLSGANANGGTGDDDFGGAVYVTGYGTRAALARSLISGNRAVAQGAGVWVGNLGSVTLVQCVLRDNVVTSAGGGGGFMANGGSVTLDRCTVVGNDAQTVASVGRVANNAYATLINCVAWGNTGSPFLWDETGGFDVSFSDVEGGYPGEGNINADPLFVNTATGDYNLLAGSPCIDVGDPTSPMDPDGSRADMGAFFFDKRVDQYHVGGEIADGMTWSGGPYHVVGMVTVPEGATLNIAEGTDVLFDADVQIQIFGDVQAVGQEGSLIRFMPGTSPQWGGLRFYGGQNTLAYVEVTGVNVASGITEIPQHKATRGSENGERPTRAERRAQPSNASRLREAMAAQGAARAAGASEFTGATKPTYTDGGLPVGAIAVIGEGTTLDLLHSSIHGNTANYGAGIYVEYYGLLTASDCNISDNHATDVTDWYYREGGGVAIYEAQAQFARCTFTGNTADDEGGGAYVENYSIQAPVSFTDCIFSANVAEQYGGGAVEFAGGSLDLTNSTFTGNSAGEAGGAVDAWKWEAQIAVATITRCEFRNNTAAQAGAVWVGYDANVTVEKCLFAGNHVAQNLSMEYFGAFGGAVFLQLNGSASFDRCTFSGNSVQPWGYPDDQYGGAIATETAVNVTSSILWGDTPDEFGLIIGDTSPSATVTYSNVDGGWPGTGNIVGDPMFVDSANGDFHLRVGSPCINRGAGEVANDPDGSPPDLGAFYFDLTGYVWGDLAGTWTKANSPYRVAAPVSVPYLSTLTIQPGVEVLFDADVPFVVEGSLQALGESGEGNGIRFVPGVAPEWGGLMFMGIGGPGGRTASPALERPAGASGEGSSTILYAEISGGDADDLSETSGPMGVMGGGVSVFGTSLDIANSRIHNNQAMFGGGLAALEGGIMLNSCVVENNVANAGLGGGFVAIYGGLMATDTEFRSNSAADTTGSFIGAGGGGGYAEESYAVFERCRFTGNTSAGNGGGVMLANDPVYGPPMEFKHCLFAGNTSAAGGGAYATVPMQGDKPAIRLPDSLRVGLAARPAAAARAQQEPGTAFVNCTFTENTATGAESGGGVPIGAKPAGTSDLLPMIYGGGLCSETSIPVTSSIVWGNTPDQIAMGGLGIPANKPAPYLPVAIVTFSDVQMEEGMVWEGEGNINADPLFVNAAEGDFRLDVYSPCVNTGDPAGAPDPNGTRADMGAFPLEFKTGDVTMDGNITGQDASKVLQFSVKLIPSIPFALADVTNNSRATALDAAMILFKWLRLSLGQDFTFPLDEGYYNTPKLAIPASPRTLTWERSGSAWELRADNPEGLMAGEFAFNVGSDVALSAEAGEYYAANRDGEVIRVAFARTDFTSPVLVRLVDDGRLLAPPSIASMELNDGATPILRVVRPVEFSLEQNTPNPFNPTTTIRFGLPVEGQVQLVVYDITGRVIRTLVDNQMEAGVHAVTWDGRDAVGRDVASGTYIYRLVAPNGVLVKRMVMVK